VFFDVLCEDNRDLCSEPFERRRHLLENCSPSLHITPATSDLRLAYDWFQRFEGAGFDGVMAKPIAGAYEPNKRTMLKVKHERGCDCVVAGFRWHKKAQDNRGLAAARGAMVIGSSFRAAPRFAAFANRVGIHAEDYDDNATGGGEGSRLRSADTPHVPFPALMARLRCQSERIITDSATHTRCRTQYRGLPAH
jgi:hypothetical protein